MMAKRSKPDKPVYAFIRHGNALVPEMEYDLRALDGIANGQRVRVTIGEWRNIDRLRAYWSMLHDVVAATGANNLTAEKLHEVLKLQNGVVELILLPSGMTVAIPGSIALERMDEPEFIEFFRKAEQWLSQTYGYLPPERGSSERSQAA